MTTYLKGDILLVEFPFVTGNAGKRRPALVLLDTGDAVVVVARITSQPLQSSHDVAISDWQAAGLRSASFVRLAKIATISKSLVSSKIGMLQPVDRAKVGAALSKEFANW